MKDIVDRIFAWADRNRRKSPEQRVALKGGGMSTIKRLANVVKAETRQAKYHKAKALRKAKEKMLFILMNPVAGRHMMKIESTKAEEAAIQYRSHLARKYGERWMLKCNLVPASSKAALLAKRRNRYRASKKRVAPIN